MWVVRDNRPSQSVRPYRVQYQLRRRGKLVQVTGGCFASAEAAALSVARMPEARVEALRRAEGARRQHA